MRRPRISLHSIRATNAVVASEAKQSMARQAAGWIASSLALLAMTAETSVARMQHSAIRQS